MKNDDFLHPKFELHTYQQMNGFLYGFLLLKKKCGAYISHELIVRLIPTWIWFDLLKINFWPSNHQFSYSFWFCQFKVTQQREGIVLQSVVLMILRLLWTSKIRKWKQFKAAWEIFRLNQTIERLLFAFQNTLLNIGPTLHCSIGNYIFFRFVSALKLVKFSDLLGFKWNA